MKVLICSLLSAIMASSAFGFNAGLPSSRMSSSVLNANAFENEIGAQPPMGFWDPLDLLYDVDQERFDRLRYVEIKHGRVAMLACLGDIVTRSGIHLKGNIDFAGTSFSSIPNGFAGLKALPVNGLLQMVALIGFLEVFVMKDSANGAAPGEFPGDFRNGSLDFGWDTFSDEEKRQKRGIELNNGRAAMMGILGIMVHDQLNGEPYVINGLLGFPGNP